MGTKRNTYLFGAVLIAIVGLVLCPSIAWAHKNNTQGMVGFSPGSTVVEGTVVAITGTVFYDGTQSSGSATGHSYYPVLPSNPLYPHYVTTGSIQIQQLRLNGNPVACGTAGAAYVTISSGVSSGGQYTTSFNTSGLGGQTIGFRTHYPASGGGSHGNSESKSECVDLVIWVALDPLPDGTASYTQGFYGSSPNGEAVVAYLMDEPTCAHINYILEKVGVTGTPYGCYADLPLMLTGTVGPGKDNGFLPSGYAPGQNIATQMITLLLNMNLAYVLPDGVIPMYGSYFLNIDVVEDLFGDPPMSSVPPTFVDPVLNIPELGSCTDVDANGVCDLGTVVLTPLGIKITNLDAAGTTVQNLLDAAYSLLESGGTTVVLNGVTLTRGDMTKIIGLINESYDEGVPTGFVTAFDAD